MFKLVRVVAKECEYACTVCVCVCWCGRGGGGGGRGEAQSKVESAHKLGEMEHTTDSHSTPKTYKHLIFGSYSLLTFEVNRPFLFWRLDRPTTLLPMRMDLFRSSSHTPSFLAHSNLNLRMAFLKNFYFEFRYCSLSLNFTFNRLWYKPMSTLNLDFIRIRYINTYLHTYINIYIHTYIHTYISTYMHTYLHTCIHTYIHI